LRSRKTICAEIAVLAVLCAIGASLPQAGIATGPEIQRFQESAPLLHYLAALLGLDHIFRSLGFALATILASASLLTVVIEQARRVSVQWRQKLSPAHFQAVPFKVEFERPAISTGSSRGARPRVEVWTERKAGLLGSFVFHLGLLMILVAGALRALFGSEAMVDLLEGEELGTSPAAWSAQWPGALGKTVQLDRVVRVVRVQASRYPSGDLRDLKVRVHVLEESGESDVEIAVNQDLSLPGTRLFLANEFGPSALLEWRQDGTGAHRQAALLRPVAPGEFRAAANLPNGDRVLLLASVDTAGNRPDRVQTRVMRGPSLLFAGDLSVGETARLPGGATLALSGTPFWARFRGSHDGSLWLAYGGFALVMLGASLIFTLAKLDWCLVITPCGERESVLVALRPQRFAPLYEDKFNAFVQRVKSESGGQLGVSATQPDPNQAVDTANLREGALSAAWEFAAPISRHLVLLLAVALAATGCGKSPTEEARQLVLRYNKTVAEAYRQGDARLAFDVAGPREGRRLLGLIGVRLDLGITLDSELLALTVKEVEKGNHTMRVRTSERWHYRDRRIGSGAQVGEESTDDYEMLYVFERNGESWLVNETSFAAPPKVGRKQMSWPGDRENSHQLSESTTQTISNQP